MQKLKLKNLGSIELLGEVPEVGKDYLITLRCSRSGIRIDERDPEDKTEIIEMTYLATENISEIGSSKQIKVQAGKTPGQALRFTAMRVARELGKEDEEAFYKDFIREKIEELENLIGER